MNKQHTGHFSASDVSEYSEALSPWDVRLTQISRGAFQGRMEFANVGELFVYRERWNKRLLVDGTTPPDHFILGAQTNRGEDTTWFGKRLGTRNLAFAAPSSELDFTSPDRAGHVVVMVPREHVRIYLGHELSARPGSRGCHEAAWTRFSRAIESMIATSQARPASLLDYGRREAFGSQILELLSQCFSDPDDNHRLGHASRWRALLRARSYIESTDDPVAVADLAAAAEVSLRTLEYSCRDALGITPVQLVHRSRMNGARRELLTSDPSSTVTAIASRWGFTELGRFSVEYRKLFGESPSETLKRSRAIPMKRLEDLMSSLPSHASGF